MFIVIEGLDGVGKSTIAKALATKMGAVFLTTPGDKFSNIRNELELIYEDNVQARQLFYMSTVVSVANDIRELIAKGKTVIVDRYWLSTQVYHHWKSEGNNFKLLDIQESLLVPDLTIYLELPLPQRVIRLAKRKSSNSEDNLTLSKAADDKLRYLYSEYSKDDITGCFLAVNAEDTVDQLVKHISLYLKAL
ncbi:dTMP kinase [Shewanella ulleungensis]|jgi:dTMP kinase|uniref:dTMP kinase n=1 Tax=Shewanella ulleungensis TaxID=2282699 RepID=UPI003D794C83